MWRCVERIGMRFSSLRVIRAHTSKSIHIATLYGVPFPTHEQSCVHHANATRRHVHSWERHPNNIATSRPGPRHALPCDSHANVSTRACHLAGVRPARNAAGGFALHNLTPTAAQYALPYTCNTRLQHPSRMPCMRKAICGRPSHICHRA